MKKAKIYKPSKTAMQSGKRNSKKWLLEFETLNTGINPLMGWESSTDTFSELKLEFSTKDMPSCFNFQRKESSLPPLPIMVIFMLPVVHI